MSEFTEGIGYNERSARMLVTPVRPSPHATVGGGQPMATYKPIPSLSEKKNEEVSREGVDRASSQGSGLPRHPQESQS